MNPSFTVATPENFDDLTMTEGETLVIAYFWGPQCPNCEVFARELPELSDAMAPFDVRVTKTDAYAFPELARRFGIFGIPSFVLFKNKQKLGMMRQYYGKDYFMALVEERARRREASAP